MTPFPGLDRTPLDGMTRAWREAVAALPAGERARLAAEHRAGRRPLVRLRPDSGPLRACAWCARLLAPDGKWIPVAHLIPPGLENPVTHGICPECAAEHFPGFPLDRASGG